MHTPASHPAAAHEHPVAEYRKITRPLPPTPARGALSRSAPAAGQPCRQPAGHSPTPRGVLTGPDLDAGDVLAAVSQWLSLPLHVPQDLVDHHCFGDIFKLAYAEWTYREEPANTTR